MSSDTDRIASLEEKVHAEAEALERMAQSHCQELATKQAEIDTLEEKLRKLAAQLELAQEELAAAQTERDGLQEEVEGWKGSCAAKAEEGLLLASDLSKVQAQLVDAQNEILQLKSVRQILWVWSCVTSPEEY